MVVQAFYIRVAQHVRSIIDVVTGGNLTNKTENEPYNLIEEMSLKNFKWPNELGQPTQVGGNLQVAALSMLNAKVDAMSQRLERLNVNAVNSSAHHPSCEICGSVGHLTKNCQVGCPFAQNTSDQVNYVNNFKARPTNDPYSNTYNPGLGNPPNFSYRPNPSIMPQMNAR